MKPKLERQIEYYRKMLNIQRLAGVTKLRSYNLAEHSFFVTILFEEFAEIEDVDYDKNTLYYILRHDFMETLTTDLPYQVKNFNRFTKAAWKTIEEEIFKGREPEFNHIVTDENLAFNLNQQQFKLMKACDILELLIFCTEEYKLGNKDQSLLKVIENCDQILRDTRYKSIIEFSESL